MNSTQFMCAPENPCPCMCLDAWEYFHVRVCADGPVNVWVLVSRWLSVHLHGITCTLAVKPAGVLIPAVLCVPQASPAA